MLIKIISSDKIWEKIDGSLRLYKISFECEGVVYTSNGTTYYKTWSKTIGEGLGKEFDVESDKRPNKQDANKTDVFIKQIKTGKFGPGRQDLDKRLASLNCAKDLAIARFNKNGAVNLDIGGLLNEADAFLKWLNNG